MGAKNHKVGSPITVWQSLGNTFINQANNLKTYWDQVGEIVRVKHDALCDYLEDEIPTNVDLSAHTTRVDNPHAVTKTQVDLGNVDNTADIDKPVSTAQANAISVVEVAKANLASPTFTGEPKAPDIGLGASNQQIVNVQYVKDTVVAIGSADMRKAIYDPNNVEQNIYDVDSHVSGTINKVFTSTEKDKLESVGKLSGKETVFSGDVITETRADGSTLVTTFNSDGTITEQLTVGLDVTSKKTTFNADGSISEVMI